MKNTVFLAILLLYNGPGLAQQENKYIREKDVSKTLSTLASDKMRGRSALDMQDIDRAATYIESQFKKAKLQVLPGLNSYRQQFQKKRISLVSLEVKMDEILIDESRLILVSSETDIVMDKNTPIDSIGAGQKLFPAISTIEKRPGRKIILVAQAHEGDFKIAQRYLGMSKLMDAEEQASGSTIYILGQHVPKTISVKASQKSDIISMYNIVGMIEGKSLKNEYVVFSGHYDHIGITEPVAGDSIANGADDDASGTTAVISLARYFRKIKSNERSLLFVAFTAEEIGGFGSQYFSKQLNPDQVVAMFNIEMIGKESKWGQNAAFITGFERSNFGEILQKNLEATPFQFHPDPYPEQDLFYRSDNATLARLGVPAHSISTDQIPTDPYYHTVDDEVETLNIANITSAIKAIALGARSIIAGTDTPTRVDKTNVH